MPEAVRAHAPIRVADAGGWSDTWFAGHGEVCHVAMAPGIEVIVGDGDPPADDFLRACLAEAGAAPETAVTVLPTGIPLGAGVGTSASLAVAVLAAVARRRGHQSTPHDLAVGAHRVETVQLGQQSGIQDQIAAAYGGVNHVVMERYPDATVTPIALSPATRRALRRLVTVYLGRPHSSSAMHQSVIEAMERGDRLEAIEPIRAAGRAAAESLRRGDLVGYGRALTTHQEATRLLHPGLVSVAADEVTEIAQRHGALGWKSNGAAGEGGTITVLTDAKPGRFQSAVIAAGYDVLDIVPASKAVVVRRESSV